MHLEKLVLGHHLQPLVSCLCSCSLHECANVDESAKAKFYCHISGLSKII